MRKRYPLELKLKAITMYNEGVTIATIGELLNVPARTFCSWKETYHKGSFLGKSIRPKTRKDVAYIKLFKDFKELKYELENVKLEREILKMGSAFLFLKPQGKYPFIQQHKSSFPIVKMCRMLKIGPVGYYRWVDRPPSKQSVYYDMLLEEVRRVYTEHKGRYGSRRIAVELQRAGFKTNRDPYAL